MEDLPVVDFKRIRLPQIPQLPRGAATVAVAALIAAVVGLNTLYQVQPEEVGVVLRFGRYVRTTTPGLRAKIPLVEQVHKVQFNDN